MDINFGTKNGIQVRSQNLCLFGTILGSVRCPFLVSFWDYFWQCVVSCFQMHSQSILAQFWFRFGSLLAPKSTSGAPASEKASLRKQLLSYKTIRKPNLFSSGVARDSQIHLRTALKFQWEFTEFFSRTDPQIDLYSSPKCV